MTTTRFSRGSGRKRSRLGRRPTLELMESRTLLATFTVTSIGDNGGVDPLPGAGTGTLRQAIIDANNAAGPTTSSSTLPGPARTSSLPRLPCRSCPTR